VRRPPKPQWLALGGELRTLRSLSGLSTRDVARLTGLSVARVSRIETGHSLLALPELDAWAAAVQVGPDAHARLRELTEAAHAASVETFRSSPTLDLQANLSDTEGRARLVVSVQPTIVPGLLQTAAYARAVLELVDVTSQDIAVAINTRLRRQEALHDPGRRFEFLITEAALRWPAGDAQLMAAQYDRIAQLSTLDNIAVGIIPLGRPVRALPWCDVNIYDDFVDGEPAAVDVELPHAEVWVTDPTDVAVYRALVQRLWDSALTGPAAGAFLAGLQRDLVSKR
jgi:transcriptional regulator with XRE-family HTH domain